ncbi:crt [Symbiodinium natans]|uniref:Crt protein n=1 Tax=Symbiodinium natans TaxID=878477 RepID=A0A812SXC8_9DINO|nr:crt [Symbiodinium natans]
MWGNDKNCWVRYFRQEEGGLEEQLGPANPFRDIRFKMKGTQATPAFAVVDWDSDGDLDWLLQDHEGLWFMDFDSTGTLRNTSAVMLVDKVGQLLSGSMLAPSEIYSLPFAAIDWDEDGDLDLLIRNPDQDAWPAEILYFERTHSSVLKEVRSPFSGFGVSTKSSLIVAVIFGTTATMLCESLFSLLDAQCFLHGTQDGNFEDWSDGASNPFVGMEGSADECWDFSGAAVTAVDWDKDGMLDLLVTTSVPYYSSDKAAGVFLFSWNHSRPLVERTGSSSIFHIWRKMAHPAVTDWDGDGDLDLILGSKYGKVEVFIRGDDGRLGQPQELLELEELSTARPVAVDWNNDGRMDLLVPSPTYRDTWEAKEGSGVLYFERQANGSLEEKFRLNASMSICFAAAVADWDGNGLLDILLPCSNDTFSLPNGSFVEGPAPVGDLEDISTGLSFVFLQAIDLDSDGRADLVLRDGPILWCAEVNASHFPLLPDQLPHLEIGETFFFADGDLDGDLDLLTAIGHRDGGTVRYFDSGYCRLPQACTGGACSLSLGVCTCFVGHSLSDCSACSRGYFDPLKINVSVPAEEIIRKCSACPGVPDTEACSGRGTCGDDSLARGTVLDGPRMNVYGNGACTCSTPFTGVRCEEGFCPPGKKKQRVPSLQSALVAHPDRTVVNCCMVVTADRTGCDASLLHLGRNAPAFGIDLLLSFLLFAVLPHLAYRSMCVEDVQLKDSTQYLAKAQNDRQLIVCDMQGTAVSVPADASQGTCYVHRLDSLLRGVLGLPFLACLGIAASALSATFLALGVVAFDAVMTKQTLSRDLRAFGARLRDRLRLGSIQDLYEFFSAYIGQRLNSDQVKLSYAEVAGPAAVRWFVSHYWGMPFQHFLAQAVGHRWVTDNLVLVEGLGYSTFANNQWQVAAELGDEVQSSSFFLALRSSSCLGTLVVLDEEVLPLTRSWCLFELFQTEMLSREKSGFQGLLLGYLNPMDGSMDVDAAAGQQPNTYELACLEEMAKLQVSLNSMSARPWFWFSGTLVLDMWEYVEAKWSEEEQLGIVPGFWPLQPAFGLLIKRCVSASCPDDKRLIDDEVSNHPGGFEVSIRD